MKQQMVKTLDGLVLKVALDDEQIEELRAFVRKSVKEFEARLCEDCPKKEVTDNVIN